MIFLSLCTLRDDKKYQSIVKKTLLERARLLLILCQWELELKSKFRLMCEGGCIYLSPMSRGAPPAPSKPK